MNKLVLLSLIALIAFSCNRPPDLRIEDTPLQDIDRLNAEKVIAGDVFAIDYTRKLPAFLDVLGMRPTPIDNKKAGLGRVLFYDRHLSKDHTVSCASCHRQSLAFSDFTAFSTGIEGRKTTRNSMPLANVASFSAHYSVINGKAPMLMWDERAVDVSAQSRQTFANPLEMGMEMPEVVARVREMKHYPYLWRQVYGHFEPTEAEVLECLQEFVGAMGCQNAMIDKSLEQAFDLFTVQTQVVVDTLISQVYFGTDTSIHTTLIGLPGLSLSQNRGRDVFVANCSKCHSPIRPFQEVFAACNGLDLVYSDQGLALLTGKPADEGVFKSPSLRNIALTAPYMHDGRFMTLKEVVEFYSSGVKPHPNLHPELKRNGNPGFQFTQQQKEDLLAFLHSFTDYSIVYDLRFSDPFGK